MTSTTQRTRKRSPKRRKASPDPERVWKNRIVKSGEAVVESLIANPLNWRTHPVEQYEALGQSLDEVGWIAGVTINETTGRMIDGHARAVLAQKRGETTIPATWVELTEEEERKALLLLDPITGMASQDKDKLRELIEGIERDVNLDGLLEHLHGSVAKAITEVAHGGGGGSSDPDDVPVVPDAPATQPGDVIELGKHRVLCGDSTDADAVASLFNGTPAAAMWTDPPYGVEWSGTKWKPREKLANDTEDALDELLAGSFTAADGVLCSGAPIYIAHPSRHPVVFIDAFLARGWRLHQTLVWVKDSIVPGRSDYHWQHEPILYGYSEGKGRYGRGAKHWYGGDDKTTVFQVPRPKASPLHPTSKPVDLVAQCLSNSTQRGDIVLDPFLGSGTTLIACQQLGRVCYGVELEPRYCDVIVQRWQEFTGERAKGWRGNG